MRNAFSNLTGVDVKPITSWETLLEVAHPLAVAKGWWEDMDRPVDEQCANFHAEISEAWEEYRSGRMETWYSSGGTAVVNVVHNADGCPGVTSGGNDDFTPVKPEGFWVEIADLLVRLADTCGRYGLRPRGQIREKQPITIPQLVTCLHDVVNKLARAEYKRFILPTDAEQTVEAVLELLAYSECVPADLWPIVNEKVAYNRTRPHRHGGKRA